MNKAKIFDGHFKNLLDGVGLKFRFLKPLLYPCFEQLAQTQHRSSFPTCIKEPFFPVKA